MPVAKSPSSLVGAQTPPLISIVEMAECLSPTKRRPHPAATLLGLGRKPLVVMMPVAKSLSRQARAQMMQVAKHITVEPTRFLKPSKQKSHLAVTALVLERRAHAVPQRAAQ
jgi:hypothetical protein